MTKKPKLTPWFPGYVLPVRVGEYERDYGVSAIHPFKCLWDGVEWRSPAFLDKPSRYQSLPWRGLAEPPK